MEKTDAERKRGERRTWITWAKIFKMPKTSEVSAKSFLYTHSDSFDLIEILKVTIAHIVVIGCLWQNATIFGCRSIFKDTLEQIVRSQRLKMLLMCVWLIIVCISFVLYFTTCWNACLYRRVIHSNSFWVVYFFKFSLCVPESSYLTYIKIKASSAVCGRITVTSQPCVCSSPSIALQI